MKKSKKNRSAVVLAIPHGGIVIGDVIASILNFRICSRSCNARW
jgi:predicted phosphoribosyltransferase